MKKIMLSILIFSILVLTSCSSIQSNMYEVRLTANIEGEIFSDSVEVFQTDEVSTTKYENPVESKFMLGKKEMVADLTSVKQYAYKSRQNVYISKDKNTEYRKSVDNNSFTIQSKNDTVLAPFTHETLTEQSLKTSVIDFLSSYVDINILNDYSYSCYTSVVVAKPNASWKETKDLFYLPQNDTESVTAYRIEFRKHCQEFATADSIIIACQANGDLSDLYYYEYNVDWEESSFDKERIEESIDDYLKDNLSNDCNLRNYSVESQRLVYLNGEIQLSLAVEITLIKDNEEVVVLCPLLLSNS